MTLRIWEALLCMLAALTGLMTLGPFLVQHLGNPGILLSELLLVGLPTVGFLQARGLPVLPALGLTPVRGWIGGALAGAGGFWLVALLEVGLDRVLPVPESVKESMQRMVGQQFILLDIVTLAIAPALCEEALFRGLVLPSLRTKMGPLLAVILSALLFAGFHLSLYRLVPTALLGLLLGGFRLWSGSLWAPMAFHAVNNTLVILLVRAGRDAPPLPTNVIGLAGLVAAVAALTVGVTIVRGAKQPA